MSNKELVPVDKTDSGFASAGQDRYLDIYIDSQKLETISDYDTKIIGEWAIRYFNFLKRDDLLPDHRERAQSNFRRLLFEKSWRSGYYDKCSEDVGEVVPDDWLEDGTSES